MGSGWWVGGISPSKKIGFTALNTVLIVKKLQHDTTNIIHNDIFGYESWRSDLVSLIAGLTLKFDQNPECS